MSPACPLTPHAWRCDMTLFMQTQCMAVTLIMTCKCQLINIAMLHSDHSACSHPWLASTQVPGCLGACAASFNHKTHQDVDRPKASHAYDDMVHIHASVALYHYLWLHMSICCSIVIFPFPKCCSQCSSKVSLHLFSSTQTNFKCVHAGKKCEGRFLGVKLGGVPRPRCKARQA